jgi:hypothetical protein
VTSNAEKRLQNPGLQNPALQNPGLQNSGMTSRLSNVETGAEIETISAETV